MRLRNGFSSLRADPGLVWTSSAQLSQDHFKQVGFVQFVEIPEDAQGRSKGRGTVRFASEQDAANAIHQLNSTELDGRTIYVKEANL